MKVVDLLHADKTQHVISVLPIDVQDAEVVGIQISDDSNRIWLCINGVSVMRIKGIKKITLTDDRLPEFKDTTPGGAHGL